MALQGTRLFLKGHGDWMSCLTTGKKVTGPSVLQKEDPGNHVPVSLTLVPGKLAEQIFPETISKPIKDTTSVARSSQHGFTKGKSWLTILTAFYLGMTGLVVQGEQWVLSQVRC